MMTEVVLHHYNKKQLQEGLSKCHVKIISSVKFNHQAIASIHSSARKNLTIDNSGVSHLYRD